MDADIQKIYSAALKVRKNSHSPYSKFPVGSALKLSGVDQIFSGCNVENASFGGTVCAERVALHSAVAAMGKIKPESIVIVTGEKEATVPCALCLQTMSEFCDDDFAIHLGNEQGILRSYKLKDLLPHPFRSFQTP